MVVSAPLVSVIMPAFNAEDCLSDAVASVIHQSLEAWELIIIDDGSTDRTSVIARELANADGRIRVLTMSAPSGGAAAPRNAGIKHAKGRFIAFLDADDLWLPEKLAVQTRYMCDHDAVVTCTGYYAFAESGDRIGTLLPPEKADYSSLLKANTAGCLTVMVDRCLAGPMVFPSCGHEDYALWLSLLRRGHMMQGIPQILAAYRVSSDSLSGNKWRNLRYFWHIYRFREHFGPLASLFLCIRYATGAFRKYVV